MSKLMCSASQRHQLKGWHKYLVQLLFQRHQLKGWSRYVVRHYGTNSKVDVNYLVQYGNEEAPTSMVEVDV